MKALHSFFLVAMISSQTTFGQQFFNNVKLVHASGHEMICFNLPKEANVFHYRVEASNDNNIFEIIGTISSAGNSVLDRAYRFELAGMDYKYYRIGMVAMDGNISYSQVVAKPKPAIEPKIRTTVEQSSIIASGN